MPFNFVRGDITAFPCDAIVNAANPSLLGGGGVDGAIHRAAGPELLAECRTLGGCETGQAKRTAAYRLPAKYVIHTVGPIWNNGRSNEAQLLAACYRNALQIAADSGCRSIAFPLISAGAYGYPREQALAVAVEAVTGFLAESAPDMQVTLVFFEPPAPQQYPELKRRLAAHAPRTPLLNVFRQKAARSKAVASVEAASAESAVCENAMLGAAAASVPECLQKRLTELDESFSQMLLRKIDERGMTDAQCYKKANIDRKLFSKIRSDVHYRPRKVTVLAFAVALELSLTETEEMLRKAGFAFSPSNPFDVIVQYFIDSRIYNIYEINEALLAFDQILLGA